MIVYPHAENSQREYRAWGLALQRTAKATTESRYSVDVKINENPILTVYNNTATRYYNDTMIISFNCKETEKICNRQHSKKFAPNIQKLALRKLMILDAAVDVNDLKIPPGNTLEKLKHNRKDQYSIRINDQWRICFKFQNSNAENVEIVDYH